MRRTTVIFALGLALFLHAGPSGAAAAETTPAEAPAPFVQAAELPAIPYLHTRWLSRDGAPASVRAIAQTPDGWLWLAAPEGLFRFDGVAFSRYQPPPGIDFPSNIQGVGSLPDGRLWVAPFFGGLILIDGPRVRVFGREHGLSEGLILRVTATPDGRLWYVSGKGLHVLDKGASNWRPVALGTGDQGRGSDLLLDRDGNLWVQNGRGNYVLRKGGDSFTLVKPQQFSGGLGQAPDGTIWHSDLSIGGLRKLSPAETAPGLAAVLARTRVIQKFLIDRRNDLWLPAKDGLIRIEMGDGEPLLQGFTDRQGLSGETALAAFEDREGNVWVSTNGGLDQFRKPRMHAISLPPYQATARPLAAGANGELWIDYSYLSRADAAPLNFGPPMSVDTMVTQMIRDRHGTVWYGTLAALWKLDGVKRVPVPVPPEIGQRRQQAIYALAQDHEDGLWVSLGPPGTWRLKDGAWSQHGGIAALEGYPAVTFAVDGDALWFGSVGNSMAILRDGQVSKFDASHGLDLGPILQIVPDADGAWLGGDGGLARFDGRRARRILGVDGERFARASGVALTPEGDMWIHNARGLARIAAGELARAQADPGHRVAFRYYDANDGLLGAPSALLPLPSMVRTTTGELVMSTHRGVFRFDPQRDGGNRLAPPVHVTAISASGAAYSPDTAVIFPAAPENVRIDYTALSLAVPQRVRFHYMLEGVDRGWQDAGNRRSAFYTGLEPGNYTFRVRAANDDGVWNDDGARLRFEVPPTLAQTPWFRFGCGLIVCLAAFGLHRLRLRMALRRMGRVFDARVAERERIARDLHDTLLQSVQGLIMHFQRIALRTPDDAPTRPLMQEALAMAEEVLEEGRDKVGGLRDAACHGHAHPGLAGQLDVHGRRLANEHGAAFVLAEEGQVRHLRPAVLDEALAIGREAVRNAFLHAQATRIEVALRYGEREFELSVTDDGAGIDSSSQQGRPGHWGIPGMRERAAELGATLELRSSPGQGSRWTLRLPARLAYDRPPGDPAHRQDDSPDGTPGGPR